MNVKLVKYVQEEGYCCLWAWLTATRGVLTSVLFKRVERVFTLRALQQNRAKMRSGVLVCEKLDCCLKERIRDGHTIPSRPRKVDGNDAGR